MTAAQTRIAIIIGIIAALILGAWWMTGSNEATSPSAGGEPEKTASAPARMTPAQLQAMGVQVAVARAATGMPLGTMPATVTLPPDARVAVTAPFSGAVRQIFVITGQNVSRGQPLATMVSRDALQVGSSLTRARAQLGYAQATADRTQQLAREGVIAGARAQEAAAALRQAQADVSENERILGLSGASSNGTITLRAPISGRVSQVAIQTGGPVDGMAAPFVIDASNIYQLDIQVPERLAGQIRPGMVVTLPGNVSGRVLSIGTAIDPDTRSILAKASIGAAPGLIAGQIVMASIASDAAASAIAVPSSSVTRSDDRDVVFVRTPNGFVMRAVTVGGNADGQTVITQGLRVGETVATSGLTEIKSMLGGE